MNMSAVRINVSQTAARWWVLTSLRVCSQWGNQHAFHTCATPTVLWNWLQSYVRRTKTKMTWEAPPFGASCGELRPWRWEVCPAQRSPTWCQFASTSLVSETASSQLLNLPLTKDSQFFKTLRVVFIFIFALSYILTFSFTVRILLLESGTFKCKYVKNYLKTRQQLNSAGENFPYYKWVCKILYIYIPVGSLPLKNLVSVVTNNIP